MIKLLDMAQIKVRIEDWGTIDYEIALAKQTKLYEETIADKINGRECTNTIVLCQHTPVYTLGKSGHENNMLLSPERLASMGVKLFHIKRGGDITFHGPGQIVMYPILNLETFGIGLKAHVHNMEEAVIRTCAGYGIECERLDGATGVWIDAGKPSARKICAIGVQSSHYVTMHGLAFNVNTDLSYFRNINPCGFIDKGVTSLAVECKGEIDINETKRRLVSEFANLLNAQITL